MKCYQYLVLSKKNIFEILDDQQKTGREEKYKKNSRHIKYDKSLFHEAFLDQFNFDYFLFDDDPLRDIMLVHQSKNFIFLVQTTLHEILNADYIEQNRREEKTSNYNSNSTRSRLG
jgi:hypothetical protein